MPPPRSKFSHRLRDVVLATSLLVTVSGLFSQYSDRFLGVSQAPVAQEMITETKPMAEAKSAQEEETASGTATGNDALLVSAIDGNQESRPKAFGIITPTYFGERTATDTATNGNAYLSGDRTARTTDKGHPSFMQADTGMPKSGKPIPAQSIPRSLYSGGSKQQNIAIRSFDRLRPQRPSPMERTPGIRPPR